jgi:hypothetical protein
MTLVAVQYEEWHRRRHHVIKAVWPSWPTCVEEVTATVILNKDSDSRWRERHGMLLPSTRCPGRHLHGSGSVESAMDFCC